MYKVEEEWKTIKVEGVKTNYSVSNHGRVRNNKTKEILKGSNKKGYIFLDIRVNKKRYNLSYHRLICYYFVTKKIEGLDINHKDGNKQNNYFANLEAVTHLENMQHAIKHNLYQVGEDRSNSKYSEKIIRKVCRMLEKGKAPKEIHEKTGVNDNVIYSIKSGRKWKHVSKDYCFPQPLKHATKFIIPGEITVYLTETSVLDNFFYNKTLKNKKAL